MMCLIWFCDEALQTYTFLVCVGCWSDLWHAVGVVACRMGNSSSNPPPEGEVRKAHSEKNINYHSRKSSSTRSCSMQTSTPAKYHGYAPEKMWAPCFAPTSHFHCCRLCSTPLLLWMRMSCSFSVSAKLKRSSLTSTWSFTELLSAPEPQIHASYLQSW